MRNTSLALLLVGIATSCGGGSSGDVFALSIPFDDFKDRAVNFPTHQVHALDFSPDGQFLYVLNQPGAELIVFEEPGFVQRAEIPVGPGLVSLRVHGQTGEVWLVDQWSSSVSVVDPQLGKVVRTIPVGAQPQDLVFAPEFHRAYVSCAGADRIDAIDTDTYGLVASMPIPARNPSALCYRSGHLFVAPLRSGNQTAPRGAGSGLENEVVAVGSLEGNPAITPLPDRDLIVIRLRSEARNDELLEEETVRGLGTVLFNVAERPTTNELWVVGTEALNAVHLGEVNFVGGRVVENRIAVVDVQSGAKRWIDLDDLAPQGASCAQPTGICFTQDGNRAFVCGFGSDMVAVLNLAGTNTTWAGVIQIPALVDFPMSSGPRMARIDPSETYLYVYDKLANGVTKIELDALPHGGGFSYAAAPPKPLGFNPVTNEERQGRAHFVHAGHSRSGKSSCSSCHVDGTWDGVVWDLSSFLDPEGTPDGELHFPLDYKGPLVTQRTQGLAATAPYHWRGEQGHLADFNRTFVRLLERESNLGDQFPYIIHYTGRLALPPNPRQRLDRSLTPEQARGARLFLERPFLDGATCADCHQLPLGTSGEITPTAAGGRIETAAVPDLRGVGDKLSAPHYVGGDYGVRTELGVGWMHGGSAATLLDVLDQHLEDTSLPGFSAQEMHDLGEFLLAFDTGISPAAAYQGTAHAGNVAGFEAELAPVLAQAREDHCDLIFRQGRSAVSELGGLILARSGLYDPAIDAFRMPLRALAPLSLAELLAKASAGDEVTFVGLPSRMGLTLALDRDLDGLWNWDELALLTDPDHEDSDRDVLPDGYEVDWGLDPLTAGDVSPDMDPPRVVGPIREVYSTATALKFEFATDEPARCHVAYNGGQPVQRLPLKYVFDESFSVVLSELRPGTRYDIELELRDPAGNSFLHTTTLHTRPLRFEAPVFIAEMSLEVFPSDPRAVVVVELERFGGAAPAPGYAVEINLVHRRNDGVLTMIAERAKQVLEKLDGTVRFELGLPSIAVLGGPGELLAIPFSVAAPPGGVPYVMGLNQEELASAPY